MSDGKVLWREKIRSEITSPLLVGEKILAIQNSGRELVMLEASPSGRSEIANARVGAMRCSSPALSDGKLFLRMADRVRCLDIAKRP